MGIRGEIGSEAQLWADVRAQFDLAPEWVQLGTAQFLASHPREVRAAIARHRRELDRDPVGYIEAHEYEFMQRVRKAAVEYLGGSDANEVALTDSSTQGLGLLYSGLPLGPGQEVLTTDHEHYSQREALRGAAERSGCTVKVARLYPGSAAETDDAKLVATLFRHLSPRTRLVAITWVHSDTGLKFPVRRLAEALVELNTRRGPEERIRLVVDGTHGLGVEETRVAELGCDFFVGDLHKWMFGPRGTGLIWARIPEWRRVRRVIPSFTETMDAYADDKKLPPMDGRQFTPGGFHALEHRWAATAAFDFHARIGRERIAARTRELNQRCKQGLARMEHVILHTPLADELSAGIVAFEIKGLPASEAKRALAAHHIVATVAPYPTKYLRFTPSILNSGTDIERGLEAVQSLRR